MRGREYDQREFIHRELERGDAVQGRLFPTAGALATTAVAAGFVVWNLESPGDPGANDWAFFLAGLVPLLLMGLYCFEVSHALIVDYYLRDLERSFPPFPPSSEGLDDTSSRLGRAPMFRSLVSALASRHGASRDISLLLFTIGLVSSGAAVLIQVAAAGHIHSPTIRTLSIALSAIVTCASVVVVARSIARGRERYRRTFERAERDARGSLIRDTLSQPRHHVHPRGGTRPLWSYLLVPRPYDFALKALGFHLPAVGVGIGVSLAATGDFDSGTAMRKALLLIIGFEFLIYQTRYMFNDWNGRKSDGDNVFRRSRGRPALSSNDPMAVRRRRTWLIVAGAMRFSAGAAFVRISSEDARDYWSIIGITIAAAGLYELSRHFTSAERAGSKKQQVLVTWAVLAFVSVGHGMRLFAGIKIGSGVPLSCYVLALACLSGALIGVAGCYLGWTLAALSYVRPVDPGVHADTVETHRMVRGNLHLAVLAARFLKARQLLGVTWEELNVKYGALSDQYARDAAARRPLQATGTTPLKWPGTWLAGATVATCAALTVTLTSLEPASSGLSTGILLAVVACGFALGAIASMGRWVGGLSLLPVAVLVGALALSAQVPVLLLLIPVLVALASILSLANSSYLVFADPAYVVRRSWTELRALVAELAR